MCTALSTSILCKPHSAFVRRIWTALARAGKRRVGRVNTYTAKETNAGFGVNTKRESTHQNGSERGERTGAKGTERHDTPPHHHRQRCYEGGRRATATRDV